MTTHTVLSYDKNGNKIDKVIKDRETKIFHGVNCYTRSRQSTYDAFFKYNKHFLIVGKPTNAPGFICLDTLQDDPDERPHSFVYWVVEIREWINGILYDGVAVKTIEKLASDFQVINGEWEVK